MSDASAITAGLLLVIGLTAMGLVWSGVNAGRTEACSALCGDHWAWQDRCVCLEVRDAE